MCLIHLSYAFNECITQLEDWAVATMLDPRFKALEFPGLTAWLNGTFTKDRALSFVKTAWSDYKPVSKKAATLASPARKETVGATAFEFDAFMCMSQVSVLYILKNNR